MVFKIILGDISQQDTEAIVNPANRSLLGGGGADGAIHRSAGPELFKECKLLGGCNIGESKLTNGYNLKAKFVIHTVGPEYGRNQGKDSELLKNCYINSLALASEKGIKSISFPSISTGAYRYPKEEACKITIKACNEFIKNNSSTSLQEIRFVVFDKESFDLYNNEMCLDY